MAWTPQQVAVFDWLQIRTDARALQVQARAGTGKTSTIIEGLNNADEIRNGGRVLLAAFNNRIAEELASRAPRGVTVKTLHSAGFDAVKAAWGRVGVDKDRGRRVAGAVLQPLLPVGFAYANSDPGDGRRRTREAAEFNAVCYAVAKLASLGKLTLTTDAPQLADLAVDFDLEIDEEWRKRGWTTPRIATFAIEAMIAAAEYSPVVDFDDMLWCPWMADLAPTRYDLVIIDEAQDMNAAQLALAIASRADDGRVLVVGDDRQCIYGFMGANVEAFDRTRDELGAARVPLSVTFRCPARVVAAAQIIVPDYEAAPGAQLGVVDCVAEATAVPQIRPGDFVLSRTNAGAVGACLALLRHGTRAIVRGRDVAASIKARVRAFKVNTIASVIAAARTWLDLEIKRAEASNRPSIAERATDMCETIIALAEGMVSVDAFIARIDDLFTDDPGTARVACSTVHKSKGLEAERVWIMAKTFWPSFHVGEENIRYVAMTRALRELHFVDGPGAFLVPLRMAQSVRP